MDLHTNDAETQAVINKTVGSELRKRTIQTTKEAVKELFDSPIKKGYNSDPDFIDDEETTEFDSKYNSYNDDPDFDDDENNQDEIVGDPHDKRTQALLKEIEENDKKDIFQDQGEHWMNLGQIVRYTINKDRKHMANVDHPYSWDEIQKRFGKGHYRITAKLPSAKNKYLGFQAKLLADAQDDLTPSRNKTDSVVNTGIPQGMSMSEMIVFFQEQSNKAEQARREAEARAEERHLRLEEKLRNEHKEKMEREERYLEKFQSAQVIAKPHADITEQLVKLTPVIAALAPFFKKEKDTSLIDLIKTMKESNDKALERSEQNMKEMLATVTKAIESGKKEKNEGYDALTVMKMVKDAEKDARAEAREMQELINEKAEELAESRGGGETSGEKDSLSETIIKGLLPTLPALLAGRGQGAPQAPKAQVLPPVHRPAVIPRTVNAGSARPTPPVQRGNPSQAYDGNPARTHQSQSKEGQERLREQNIQQNKEGVSNLGSNNAQSGVAVKKSFLNADMDDDKSFSTEVVPSYSAPVEQKSELDIVLSQPKSAENITAINNILFPLVVENFADSSITMEAGATKIISELERSGINLATVIRDFDDETLNVILVELDPSFHELVKGLHNEIISQIVARY